MRSEELRKLLDSTVAALQPEALEPILVETIYKEAPAWTFYNQLPAETKYHEFNTRTALPSPGFEGELAVTAIDGSSYQRNGVTLKILRTKGAVTNIAQMNYANYLDAFKTEVLGSTKALGWMIEAAILWGNAAADTYQFSGVDTLVTTNVTDHNAMVSLALLDNMIDASDLAGGAPHKRAFVMGHQIRSALTRILRNQFHAPELVELRGGLTVPAYRGIPLLASSGVNAAGTMTTVAAAGAAGGALTSGTTYIYSVAPVTIDGEQKGSAEVSQAPGGGNGTINLSWTAYTGAFLYKIYRGTVSGSLSQVAVIAAKTYNGSGTVTGNVTGYSDVGGQTPVTSRAPLGTNDQCVFLLDADSNESAEIRYLSEGSNIVQYMDLAQIADQKDYLLRSMMALVMKYEKVSAIARRVRPS